MSELLPRLLCQIYLVILLLAAATLLWLPHSPPALALLLMMLFIIFRPLYSRLNIVVSVAAFFLLPVLLEPLVKYLPYYAFLSSVSLTVGIFDLTLIQILVVMATLPTLYLLDYSLRQSAQGMPLAQSIKGRYVPIIPTTLFISTLAILFVSVVVSSSLLFFSGIILVLYLLIVLLRVLLATHGLPLDIPVIQKRIIAGNTADISLYPVSKATIKMYGLLSPVDSWVRVMPQIITLNKSETKLNLIITPPLAGSSHPQLRVSVTDSRGFIRMDHVVEPVELHVIPRARYAVWLATRFLEQTGERGILARGASSPQVSSIPKRGIEYADSRNYQPGDPLVHVDWKHTLKLNRLIIKEYIEAGERVAIIAANLAVADAEEADKLAFNLITTALTLAREAIPTALAVYNHQEVVLTTPLIDPRESLKQTLTLVKDITPVEFAHRFLRQPDIKRLRWNIAQLKQATSGPAQRLLDILGFEYQAIEAAAKNHPATIALSWVAKHAPPPAVIILISQLNHDAEALLVTAEKLSKRGFTTMTLDTSQP